MSDPYRPMTVTFRRPLWQRVLQWVINTVAAVVFAAGLTVLLLEFIVGCGETYLDAQGERHRYECLIIPQQPAE